MGLELTIQEECAGGFYKASGHSDKGGTDTQVLAILQWSAYPSPQSDGYGEAILVLNDTIGPSTWSGYKILKYTNNKPIPCACPEPGTVLEFKDFFINIKKSI